MTFLCKCLPSGFSYDHIWYWAIQNIFTHIYPSLQEQNIFNASFKISYISRKKSKLQRKRCDRTLKLRLLYPLKPLLSRYFHKLPQRKVHDTGNKKGFSKSKYGLTIFFLNAHIFGGWGMSPASWDWSFLTCCISLSDDKL